LVSEICDGAEVPHPTIITESGRAIAAYHSVLVFDVLGTFSFDAYGVPSTIEEAAGERNPQDLGQPLWDLYTALATIGEGRLEEALHDATQAHDEAQNLFRLGYMDLADRGLAERLYWRMCWEILRAARTSDEELPEEIERLADQMSDIYFCNLSIFQSMPDSWAIDQLFPVLPIHRHREEPTRRAILADITCDSEGKIDRFSDGLTIRRTLPLHVFDHAKPYYLAAFLVGAYQEILGDLHNLFGDTHAVHIGFDEDGEWAIEEVVPGDTVREVLSYVQYEPERLERMVRQDVERAVRRKQLTVQEGRQLLHFYQHGLDGYTYLEQV
jgi:arginine decarboxylase